MLPHLLRPQTSSRSSRPPSPPVSLISTQVTAYTRISASPSHSSPAVSEPVRSGPGFHSDLPAVYAPLHPVIRITLPLRNYRRLRHVVAGAFSQVPVRGVAPLSSLPLGLYAPECPLTPPPASLHQGSPNCAIFPLLPRRVWAVSQSQLWPSALSGGTDLTWWPAPRQPANRPRGHVHRPGRPGLSRGPCGPP